jgi:hypothetical protein
MTEPHAPPPARYNRAVVGGLVFVVFHLVLVAVGMTTPPSPAGLIVGAALFANVVIPVMAAMLGWGRFAAGWAIAAGVTMIVLLGLCVAALSNWS